MKIITCVSDIGHPGYLAYLQASCRHHGHELVTLSHAGAWTSHRIKDRCLASYLTSLPSAEVVLFSDGYDAMLLAGEGEIREKYSSFGKPLVFSAEINCWPWPALAERYSIRDASRPFLNCGGFVGRSDIILELLEKYPSAPSGHSAQEKIQWEAERLRSGQVSDPDVIFQWSNQYYWTHVFLRHPDLIALDHECTLFLTLSTSVEALRVAFARPAPGQSIRDLCLEEEQRLNQEFHYASHRLVRTPSGATPCHVHLNGPVAKELANQGYFLPAMPWHAVRRTMLA